MSKLVIVESPTKAKTIAKFLGKDYEVESSFGHIRDLPRSTLGIDVDHDFEPKYLIPAKSRKTVTNLKKLTKKSDGVILATDEDREGEAIAWHLAEALDLKDSETERIVFHEITKKAIEEALEHPRQIDMKKVDAQQARRILDRIVGYKLSPFLWKKVARRLSAGRVQSVALRLIVEREEEIRKFKPEEYWTIVAILNPSVIPSASEESFFESNLIKINDEILDKLDIKNKTGADKIVADLEKAKYQVASVQHKEVKRNPSPPFTTSTLQQTSSSRMGFTAKKTMFLAQKLYEHGHITYMRTDSVNLSQQSLSEAKNWLQKSLGKKYAEQAPRFFKTKSKGAQEAHEAIRPAHVNTTPDTIKLAGDEKRIYELIWQRFVASQMPQAIFDHTTIDIKADKYTLRTTGNVLRFDGFLKIWPQKSEDKIVPELKEKEELDLKEIQSDQHFTEPPPRFNEASLVKTLEEFGIGRPSTYAPIISVIQDRGYVEKDNGRFVPTKIGETVNKMLVEHFPQIVDIGFTSDMENSLDAVADGKEKWQDLVGAFYEPFIKNLEVKYKEVKDAEKIEPEKTDEVCEECGKPMVIRTGRFGKFMACSGFPECKNTKKVEGEQKAESESTGIKCEECGEGELLERFTRKGHRKFWGCSRYPKCQNATWEDPAKKPA